MRADQRVLARRHPRRADPRWPCCSTSTVGAAARGRRARAGRPLRRPAEVSSRWLAGPAATRGSWCSRRSCSAPSCSTSRSRAATSSVDNFVNLFQLHIEKVIVVVTMTFVIISGEIDLSVASVMAWSAAVLAALHEHDAPMAVAIVVALAAAAAAGLIQGWCVARLGLPSLVVTLAGLIGWRGAARILVEDRSIGDFPDWFDRLGQDELARPAAARAGALRRAVRRRVGGAPALGGRARALRHRRQRRGGPLLGCRRRAHPARCCS